MGRFLLAALALSLVATPAMAQDLSNDDRKRIMRWGREAADRVVRERPPLISSEARFMIESAIADTIKLVCGEELKFVVAEVDDATGLAAGFLVPLSKNAWEVGGWHRVMFDAATGEPKSIEPLSRGCLGFPKENRRRNRTQVELFFVSQILEPHPTENHVALSLWQSKDVLVVTEAGTWKVSNGRISFVSER
ncbi:MAG: hypothetical protein AAF830_07655 [Pseudomonadota bacterium]